MIESPSVNVRKLIVNDIIDHIRSGKYEWHHASKLSNYSIYEHDIETGRYEIFEESILIYMDRDSIKQLEKFLENYFNKGN